MKTGLRKPSPRKAIAARLSPARVARHSLGLKAPRGLGVILSPGRASSNFFYSRTTFPLGKMFSGVIFLFLLFAVATYWKVIVFLFWTAVVIGLLLVLALIWLAHRNNSPPDNTKIHLESIRLAEIKAIEQKEDYTKWSKAKWRAWERNHAWQIESGEKPKRSENVSQWTKEERLDWEKEEWLRVIVKGKK